MRTERKPRKSKKQGNQNQRAQPQAKRLAAPTRKNEVALRAAGQSFEALRRELIALHEAITALRTWRAAVGTDAATWFPDVDFSGGVRLFYSQILPHQLEPVIERLERALAEAAQWGAAWLAVFDACWPGESFRLGLITAKSPARALYSAAEWHVADARECLMNLQCLPAGAIDESDRILMQKIALPFPELPAPTLGDTHDAMARMTLARKRLAIAEALDSIAQHALAENTRMALQHGMPRGASARETGLAAEGSLPLPTRQAAELPVGSWASFEDATKGLDLSERSLRRLAEQGRLRRVYRGRRSCGYLSQDIQSLMESEPDA